MLGGDFVVLITSFSWEVQWEVIMGRIHVKECASHQPWTKLSTFQPSFLQDQIILMTDESYLNIMGQSRISTRVCLLYSEKQQSTFREN